MIDQLTGDDGAAPAPPPPPPPMPPPRPEAAVFTGTGADYFRIWIVNLLLTIATFGIYSAWAKVRSLQYFYRHTRLAGAGFDYHGTPLAILKGRIVAAALFGGYYVAGLVSPTASGVAFLVLMALMPFLVARSLRFRFANSSYRGIRFGFDGTMREAYAAFLLGGVAAFFSLLMLTPWWHYRVKRFVYRNARYGRTPFTFDAPVGEFFGAYLRAAGIAIAGVALAFAVVIMLGVMAGIADVEPPLPREPLMLEAVVVIMAVVYVTGSVLVWAVIRARIQNASWNHTRLGSHQFRSELDTATLVRITITNLLGIIATLGLYKPFAEIRLARAVVGSLTLVPAGSLDGLLAGERQDVSSAGEEAVDLFDVDVGF